MVQARQLDEDRSDAQSRVRAHSSGGMRRLCAHHTYGGCPAGRFNSTNDSNGSFDRRSDNKGPEPEGVTVAKIFGREYVFVALERIGGILVYDVTSPRTCDSCST
jgi:hypothetical protein